MCAPAMQGSSSCCEGVPLSAYRVSVWWTDESTYITDRNCHGLPVEIRFLGVYFARNARAVSDLR